MCVAPPIDVNHGADDGSRLFTVHSQPSWNFSSDFNVTDPNILNEINDNIIATSIVNGTQRWRVSYQANAYDHTARGPAAGNLHGRLAGTTVLTIVLPTLCADRMDSPWLVWCGLPTYRPSHELAVAFAPGTLRIADVALYPPDVPFADLAAAAVVSSDLPGLVWAAWERLAAYARRYQAR